MLGADSGRADHKRILPAFINVDQGAQLVVAGFVDKWNVAPSLVRNRVFSAGLPPGPVNVRYRRFIAASAAYVEMPSASHFQ